MSAIPPEIFIVDEDDAGYTWYLVRRLCKPQQAECIKPRAVKTAEVNLQHYGGTPVELMRVPYGLLKRGVLVVTVRFNPLPLEECNACPARYIYYFAYDYVIRNYINCEMHVRILAGDDGYVVRNVGAVLHKFDVFDGAVEHTFFVSNDYANGIVHDGYFTLPEADCEADKLEVKVVYEGCEASNLYIYAVLYVL
jgi:hypothetical protein